jgi:O-antigen/teichoic acid export membrane protein
LSASRLLSRANERSPLPEGTLPVGAGLVISGICAYVFLAVAGHHLDDAAFAPLSQLWFITFIVAPGFFLPVEQELGRALAHRRALQEGNEPVVRKAAILAMALASFIILAIVAFSPLLVDRVFHGSWALLVGLILAFVGYGTGHFIRGLLSGSGRFGGYGTFMGADGIIRVIGTGLLVVAGVTTVGWFGLAIGLPPILAVFVAMRGQRGIVTPGPDAEWNELTPNLGWLLMGSVLAAALVNAGPIAANILATNDQKDLVTAFAKGVLLARVPLFLFQAVQAALLPKLARLAARGELTEFRAGFRKLVLVIVGVGFAGTLGAFALGSFAVKVAFGSDLGRRTITLLALSSALYMVAVGIAQALIALHGHARVAVGWLIGFVVFVVVTAIAGTELLLRVEIGLVAGSLAALIFMATALLIALHEGETPDLDSLVEALHEMPLEQP